MVELVHAKSYKHHSSYNPKVKGTMVNQKLYKYQMPLYLLKARLRNPKTESFELLKIKLKESIQCEGYKKPFVFKGIPEPHNYRPSRINFFGILTLYIHILVRIIVIEKIEADEFLILYALANISIRVQLSFHIPDMTLSLPFLDSSVSHFAGILESSLIGLWVLALVP